MVPGESEMNVSTLVQYSDLSGPKSNEFVDWVTEAREVTAGVCVSKTVVPDRDEDVPVRVINVTRSPVVMKAGTIISDLDSAQVCGVQNGGTTSGQGPGRIITLLTRFRQRRQMSSIDWLRLVITIIDEYAVASEGVVLHYVMYLLSK